MSQRSRFAVVILWPLSILLVGAFANAQSRWQRWTPLGEPVVMSGADLGFRVEWMNGSVPTGTLVVRLNGQWVEAQIGKPGNHQVIPSVPPAPQPPR